MQEMLKYGWVKGKNYEFFGPNNATHFPSRDEIDEQTIYNT